MALNANTVNSMKELFPIFVYFLIFVGLVYAPLITIAVGAAYIFLVAPLFYEGSNPQKTDEEAGK